MADKNLVVAIYLELVRTNNMLTTWARNLVNTSKNVVDQPLSSTYVIIIINS